ncbi:3443_t:CDS:1 [Entrophospora sp. SA101]|nr:6251_t:CDS:1 [Entrophospora sp. SA101]CAJ0633026.1 3443_t:CDS:1 [Entrophospora sp. SA101]CAJ0841142.1 11738_t:CDS:1 [Entrophospora sp. SA101]CAJ0900828.1 4243_t:CDS:1 [Entrophospora sp. SA101]
MIKKAFYKNPFKFSFNKTIHHFHSISNLPNRSFLPLFPREYYVDKPLEFVAPKTLLPLLSSIQNDRKDETWLIYQQLLASEKLHLLTTQHFSLLLQSINFKTFPPNKTEIQHLTEQLFSIFRQMKYLGHKPDVTDYTHLLSIFSRLRDVKLSEKLWQEAIDDGVVPSIHLYNTYLASCLHPRRPNLGKAKAILHDLKKKQIKNNLTTLSLVIRLYAKEFDIRIAQEFLEITFLPTVKLNYHQWSIISTFLEIFKEYGRLNDLDSMDSCYRKFLSLNLKPEPRIYKSLIRWSCVNHNIEQAKKYLEEMISPPINLKPDLEIFNYMIASECRKCKTHSASDIAKDMKRKYNMMPSEMILIAIFKTMIRKKRFIDARFFAKEWDFPNHIIKILEAKQ